MDRLAPHGTGVSYEPTYRGRKKFRARLFGKGAVDLGRYHTAADARQALDQAGELLRFFKIGQQGVNQALPVVTDSVVRAVQRVIAKDPQLYWAAPADVWGNINAHTAAFAAAAAVAAEEDTAQVEAAADVVLQVAGAAAATAVEAEAVAEAAASAAAAAATAAAAQHYAGWQQSQQQLQEEIPAGWMPQPARPHPPLQQATPPSTAGDVDASAAVAAEAAAAAAAAALGPHHHDLWQQQELVGDPYAWLMQPAQQPGLMQQPVLPDTVAPHAATVPGPVGAEPGLHSFVDLLLCDCTSGESDESHITAPQPTSSEGNTATSPKPAAAAARAPSVQVSGLLLDPLQTQNSLSNDSAAAEAAVSASDAVSPRAAESSAAPAVAVRPSAPFLQLATGYELMLVAAGGLEQLLDLYNQRLVPLMGVPNAPVRLLLVQWLPAARQAIMSSGQPPSVQQAVMQLMSSMVHAVLSWGASSSSTGSSGCSSGTSQGRDVATPAGSELVFFVVERLMRSLEELREMCSQDHSGLMEPDAAASTLQLWHAQMVVPQPDVPASRIIRQLAQQLGA